VHHQVPDDVWVIALLKNLYFPPDAADIVFVRDLYDLYGKDGVRPLVSRLVY
jgi:hypothetical protein